MHKSEHRPFVQLHFIGGGVVHNVVDCRAYRSGVELIEAQRAFDAGAKEGIVRKLGLLHPKAGGPVARDVVFQQRDMLVGRIEINVAVLDIVPAFDKLRVTDYGAAYVAECVVSIAVELEQYAGLRNGEILQFVCRKH